LEALGVYKHFLRDGADNVFAMAASASSARFRTSAVLLPLVQLLGCILAVRVLRPVRPTK
jgi:hypothetical protein